MQQLLRAVSHIPCGRATFKPGITAKYSRNLSFRPRCTPQLHCAGRVLCRGSILNFGQTARPASAAHRLMATVGTSQHTHTNRLAQEESPYLLQHQHNPVSTNLHASSMSRSPMAESAGYSTQVDWYPWSNEAFDKAKKEDKPIFLSVGYSTCHWSV